MTSLRALLLGIINQPASVSQPEEVLYTYLLTVSEGTYTATDAEGAVVSTNSSLLTVMNAIKAAGVKIQFAEGTFDYGDDHPTFNTLDGIEFWGSGIDVTIVQNSENDAADTEPFSFTRCDDVVIRDMTVSAGGTARSSSDAIDNDGGSNWLVERVKVPVSRGSGIVFDGKDSVDAPVVGGIIRDCEIYGTQGSTAGHGIKLLATVGVLVETCNIHDTAAHGIQIVKGSTASGVKATDNILRGNTINQAGRDGISIVSCDDNTIEGNTITNSANVTANRDGMRVETADGVTADGNIFDGNTCFDDQTPKTQRYGMNLTSSGGATLINNSQIINNVLTGNVQAAGYLNGGTGTTVSGNTPA